MAWYNGTYSCGHEGRTNIVGPTKNREWICERHFEKLCPDCYKEHLESERQKANAKAAEKAVEMELPKLAGTEKQVAWANTLRQKLIDYCEKRFELAESRYGKKSIDAIAQMSEILNYVLSSKTSASWYIDTREEMVDDLFRAVKKEIDAAEEAKRPEVKEAINEQKDLRTNAIVWPENSKFKEAAEIVVNESKIMVSFEKNDKFREVVKAIGYEWGNGYWQRELNSKNGTANDRAAELGNKLLNAGFPIMIVDNSIRQNAIEGKYETECKRWIQIRDNGEHKGKFAINWGEQNDKLYNSARSLPGSKWSSPSVIVKVNYYKEVQDFAVMFGFKFSKGALKAIEEQKQLEENKNVVAPAKVEKEKPVDGLKEILNSSEEIIDDLKD